MKEDEPIADTGDAPDPVEPEINISKPKAAKKAVPVLDPDVFGDVAVELTASLGRGTMTVHELGNLSSGEVVALETPLNGLVDLALNGRIVARGEIVAVGDKFGVRISEIVARK